MAGAQANGQDSEQGEQHTIHEVRRDVNDLSGQPSQSRKDQQLNNLEQDAIGKWLTASEGFDHEVMVEDAQGNTRAEIRDLQREIKALEGLNHSLARVMQHTPGMRDADRAVDDDAIQWIQDNVAEIQVRIGALADEIQRSATISEETRVALLAQYEALREELEDVEDDPDRASTALESLRKWISAVAHFMQQFVRDAVHEWLPIARYLLPLLGPGGGHTGG